MNPNIFIDDFERTEHSDELHAILGRALIIATRFDSMCKAAAVSLKLQKGFYQAKSITDSDYETFVSDILLKTKNLNNNIQSIGLPAEISVVLHDAREARNSVAHDISAGLEGCIDTKIDENAFIRNITELTMDLAYGDIAISYVVSVLNRDPIPNREFVASYNKKIVDWVVERQ